jgi:2-polyprenyl-6-methoxyphenol hydroxylase-like FAD-dependent oxidoreductase
MASQAFKVIVVGGGPVGLTAAHALTRADIDFIVLERREDAIIDAGSNLVLLPQGLRILSQIGLLDSLHNVSSPMRRILRFDHSGRSIGDMHWFTLMKEQ